MKKISHHVLALAVVCLLPVSAAHAQLGGILNQFGSGAAQSSGTPAAGLGAIGGTTPAAGSLGNVVGLLKFCIENNYLGGNARSVQHTLMGKLGDNPASNPGYASGLVGILEAGNGQTLNLGGGATQPLSQQICTRVLAQAKSFL